MNKLSREKSRKRRKRRVRVKGTKKVPRLSVFRSNQRVYLQLIDDESGKTLAGILAEKKGKKEAMAKKAGEAIGALAKKLKIKRAVFDRGGYKFHGRIKAVLLGAESKGLKFKKD